MDQSSFGILAHNCSMYIPLSGDKHRKVRDSSKKCTGNPRQNAVQDKIQSENFFLTVGKFFLWT